LIRIAILIAAFALVGCRRPPPVVQSCADNLSGIWRAGDERHSQFKITDHGKQVVLEPIYAVGGDYGAFKTVLFRSERGLEGATTSTYTEGGKTCPVKFASRIDSCTGGKLELWGETQFEIKVETCETIPNGVMQNAVLVREKP
jgi:hypothetical protein